MVIYIYRSTGTCESPTKTAPHQLQQIPGGAASRDHRQGALPEHHAEAGHRQESRHLPPSGQGRYSCLSYSSKYIVQCLAYFMQI